MTDLLASQQSCKTVGKNFSGYFVGRRVKKVSITLVRQHERLNFAPKILVIKARLIQKVRPFRRRPLQRRVEELVNLLPPFRFHDGLSVNGFGAYLFEVLKE